MNSAIQLRRNLAGLIIATSSSLALTACGKLENNASYRIWEESRLSGLTAQKRHDGDGALAKMQEALTSARELHEDNLRQSISCLDVAELLLEKGDAGAATNLAWEAVKKLDDLKKQNTHFNQIAEEQRARAHLILADTLSGGSDWKNAISNYKIAQGIYDGLIRHDNKDLLTRHYRIRCNMALSDLVAEHETTEEALALSQQAYLEARQSSAPEYLLGAAREQYALRLKKSGDEVAAKELFSDIEAINLLSAGVDAYERDDIPTATKFYERALDTTKNCETIPILQSKIYNQLTHVYHRNLEYKKAIYCAEQALKYRRIGQAVYSDRDERLLSFVAVGNTKLGNTKAAVNAWKAQLEIKDKLYDEQSYRIAETLMHLVSMTHGQDSNAEKAYLARGMKIVKYTLTRPQKATYWNSLFKFAVVVHETGHLADAAAIYNDMLKLYAESQDADDKERICSLSLQRSWIAALAGDAKLAENLQNTAFECFTDLRTKRKSAVIQRLEHFEKQFRLTNESRQLKICQLQLQALRSKLHAT